MRWAFTLFMTVIAITSNLSMSASKHLFVADTQIVSFIGFVFN